MEFIKIEPDPGAELYPASCSGSQLLDVKEEVKPVLVSFPLMKMGHNMSCLCVCLSVCCCWNVIVQNLWPFCVILHAVCNSSLFSSSIYEYCLNPAVFTKTLFPTLKAMWYVTFCILYYCDVCMCVCCFFNPLVPDVKCICDVAWYLKCRMRSTAHGSSWLLLCGPI